MSELGRWAVCGWVDVRVPGSSALCRASYQGVGSEGQTGCLEDARVLTLGRVQRRTNPHLQTGRDNGDTS